jgi:hypothetical protein
MILPANPCQGGCVAGFARSVNELFEAANVRLPAVFCNVANVAFCGGSRRGYHRSGSGAKLRTLLMPGPRLGEH